MIPTVGRIVYYKSYGTPNGEHKSEDRAAIITGVVNDTTLHLCVLNPTGMFFNTNVRQGSEGGQWDWIPYQKEQQEQATKCVEPQPTYQLIDFLRVLTDADQATTKEFKAVVSEISKRLGLTENN